MKLSGLMRRALAAGAMAAAMLAGAAHAQMQGHLTGEWKEYPRGTYKKYEGNPKNTGSWMAASDEGLGTPPSTAPRFGPWNEIDGRKVRVVSRFAASATFLGRGDPSLSFYGLEDDKGKVLLPVVFRTITVVAGRIYIQSYLGQQPFERYDVKTGGRTVVPKLYNIWTHTLDGSDFGGAVLAYMGEEATVIAPRVRVDAKAAPGAAPAKAEEKKIVTGHIEIIGADGQLKHVYADLAPVSMSTEQPLYGSSESRKFPLYLHNVSAFWVMGLVAPNGQLAMQALDRNFEPVGKAFPWAVRGGKLGFVVPAPDVPDAWVKVTPAGMSAPEGALAYRPMGFSVGSEADYIAYAYEKDGNYGGYDTNWLVAYPAANGGVHWGHIDLETGKQSGPLWRDARRIKSELLDDGWSLMGPNNAVQLMDGTWRTMSKKFLELDDKVYPDLAALISAREAIVLEWRASQQRSAELKAEYERLQAASELDRKRQRWRHLWQTGQWQEISQLADAWGGEFFLEYYDNHPAPTVAEAQRGLTLSSGDMYKRFEQKLAEAKEREKEYARIRMQSQIEVLQEEAARQRSASLFVPDYSEYRPINPSAMTQGLVDYNARINRENCAVADKGGARTCNR